MLAVTHRHEASVDIETERFDRCGFSHLAPQGSLTVLDRYRNARRAADCGKDWYLTDITNNSGRGISFRKRQVSSCRYEDDGVFDGSCEGGDGTTVEEPLGVDDAIEREIKDGDGEAPFFVCDVGAIVKQFKLWHNHLPTVKPFYAAKCNGDPVLMKLLARLGANFDCASKAEIASVLEMGVPPDRIIYANPCKPASHIRFAKENGVKLMTFDNLTELVKISREYPDAELVLRIVTDDKNSVCRFSVKFGAELNVTRSLLVAAKEMGLAIVGVSFHVGSGCQDANQYQSAIKSARCVFDAAREVGYDLKLLDIGGGFPGSDKDAKVSFGEIASVVKRSIDVYFPAWEYPDIEVIAEPGRFFASAAFTLTVCITSCRMTIPGSVEEHKKAMYYVNDGVYGSFNCLLFDHAVCDRPEIATQRGSFVLRESMTALEQQPKTMVEASIWGPTCDSMDCIAKGIVMPELEVGDWLTFREMGAYTLAAASTFNGFPRTSIHYINV